MKRSVLVAAGTAVGVTAVVSYHAASPSTSLSLAAASGTPLRGASTHAAHGSASHTAATHGSAAHTSTSSASASAGATASASAPASPSITRSAVGQMVGYPYGELSVKVTERGGRISSVTIAKHLVSDPQSASIDGYAIPRLSQQVLSVQGARIDGVSGASYTSQAYAQSVQSALDKLK